MAHTGYHGCEVLDVAHLLDLLYLLVEVPEVELVLGQFLSQLAGLLLVVLFLGLLDQGDHVAHAEYTVGDTVGMEDIEGLHLLAGADELDRLVDHGLDREGSTAAGITVHLCEHHSVEVETVVEGLGGLHGVLTGHGVDHEEGLGRRYRR